MAPSDRSLLDPVTEAYKKDIDRTLLRENLEVSVEGRLRQLMELQRLTESCGGSGGWGGAHRDRCRRPPPYARRPATRPVTATVGQVLPSPSFGFARSASSNQEARMRCVPIVVAAAVAFAPILAYGQANIESSFQGLLDVSRADTFFVVISIEQAEDADAECAAQSIAPLDSEARRVLQEFGHNVEEMGGFTEANAESSVILHINFTWTGVAPVCVGVADFKMTVVRRWLGIGAEDLILMPDEDASRVKRLLPYMLQMLPRGEVLAASGRAVWISPTAERFQRASLSAVNRYVTAIANRVQAVQGR